VTTGVSASEVVVIKTVATNGNATRLTLEANLTSSYQRSTVTINANVARATHGETHTDEILGSGDSSRPFQRFPLKQRPLTFVSAPVPGGAASTLEVRVKGVLWDEWPSFYGVGSGDRAFVIRRAEDGSVTVRFGDGSTGARLPTGTNNVTATYRTGIGLAGHVDAGTITTLLSRPLGLKATTNPIRATGAGSPEALADARVNAPLTVLTLDRIVSVQDFEDFARAFAGIGKAQATLLWNGERQLVHLTVAAADGTAVDPTSHSFRNLISSIDSARHSDQSLRVSPHHPLTFSLAARIAVEADRIPAEVFAGVKSAIVAAFAFEVRSFGQGVTASELLAVMQNVAGVVAIDLDTLNGRDPIQHPNLPARIAHWDGTAIQGAELLLVDPDGITLTELPL
jgi:predicted phage baseplate assembly protein